MLSHNGRSREGAWIEITPGALLKVNPGGRSREGAWIEIGKQWADGDKKTVAPARERGLKSEGSNVPYNRFKVAPARERGLKYNYHSLSLGIL